MKMTNRSLTYAVGAAAVLLGLSGAMARAVDAPTTEDPTAGPAAPSVTTDAPAGVRIVAPGERVAVTPDASVWLTEDGRMCDQVMRLKACYPMTTTDRPFVGPVTGTSTPERHYWIGEFRASGAARLVVRDTGAAHEGTLITQAGEPGWGAWYADVPPHKEGDSAIPDSLTVYDAAGKVLVDKDLT
ncbi:hypothetical protein [Streptomyces sp. NPDC057418]|uniref:hypothetical protein n=1 Tax=unclassified Streptomyces TaxID=2593676 RepID=UPI00367617D5